MRVGEGCRRAVVGVEEAIGSEREGGRCRRRAGGKMMVWESLFGSRGLEHVELR